MQQGAALYGAPGYNSPFQQQQGGYGQHRSPPGGGQFGAPPTPTPGYGANSSYGSQSGPGGYRPSPSFAPPRQESMMGDPYGQRELRLMGIVPLLSRSWGATARETGTVTGSAVTVFVASSCCTYTSHATSPHEMR